ENRFPRDPCLRRHSIPSLCGVYNYCYNYRYFSTVGQTVSREMSKKVAFPNLFPRFRRSSAKVSAKSFVKMHKKQESVLSIPNNFTLDGVEKAQIVLTKGGCLWHNLGT
ncbi:MAG: hypothetical protein IKT72_05385, partial [Clostridia bacterium]|nr:hypothetical protein [Clostridia bacterium]